MQKSLRLLKKLVAEFLFLCKNIQDIIFVHITAYYFSEKYWVVTLLYVFVRDVLFRVFVIYPKTNISGQYASFIEEASIRRWITRDKIDSKILFLGNSHVMDGINPSIVSSATGKSCFNFAFYSVNMPNMLERAVDLEVKPQYLVIDVSTRYSMYSSAQAVQLKKWQLGMLEKRDKLLSAVDHVHCLAPSLFVPKQFSPIWMRCLSKIFGSYKRGYPSAGRYSPFARKVSFEWRLNKSTNHRTAKITSEKSSDELKEYDRILDRSIHEAKALCPVDSDEYKHSFSKVEESLNYFKLVGTQVLFVRLPLDRKMICYENEELSRYFRDLSEMALEHGAKYIDLTSDKHSIQTKNLSFYNDGMHLTTESADEISRYLSAKITDLSL